MLPICPPPAFAEAWDKDKRPVDSWLTRSGVATAHASHAGRCMDAVPNYERFGPFNDGSGFGPKCLALRFSLLSESAAFGLEAPQGS